MSYYERQLIVSVNEYHNEKYANLCKLWIISSYSEAISHFSVSPVPMVGDE
jgi:hypothetical protein